MEDKFPITVVMLTHNKEHFVAKPLESVAWADEIIVVDDMSTDKTVEIARRFTDKVFVRKMDIEGRHRNWAYAQGKHPWILSLDDDEMVSLELKDEIKKVISGNPPENGFTIPRKNYIGDYWIKYGGLYPSPQLRLFKRGKFKYEEVEVHPRAFMDDPCGRLKGDIIHYTYRDYADFLAKLNKQTSLEALKWYRNNKPMRLGRFTWRTIDRFMRTYFGKKSRKDGFIGFLVAFNAGLYQFLSYLKYREMALKDKNKK